MSGVSSELDIYTDSLAWHFLAHGKTISLSKSVLRKEVCMTHPRRSNEPTKTGSPLVSEQVYQELRQFRHVQGDVWSVQKH